MFWRQPTPAKLPSRWINKITSPVQEAPYSHSLLTMPGAQKLYPRSTIKRIVKAHSKKNLSKNVDVLVGRPVPAYVS